MDSDNYWLIQDLGGGQEWRVKLLNNGAVHCLENSYAYEAGAAVETLFDEGSVWEYAFSDPTYGWIGNGHGQDYQDSLTFAVDGQPVELEDGQKVTGSSVTITRASHFEAADTTPLGSCTLVYSLDPATGLSTDITIEWAITPPTTGFNGMFPVNDRFSRGRVLGSPQNFDLTAGETSGADISTPSTSSPLAWVWEYGQAPGWAAMVQSGDGRSRDTYIQDRGTEALNKIYPAETGEGGSTRHFTNNYRVKRLEDPDRLFLGL